MAVATSGYMAIIIDFSGLVAARCQADPRANRSGFPKVVRLLNSCGKRGCGDRTDARNRHEDAAGLTLARIPNQLATEFGGADANATPGFQHRKHDGCKSVLISQKVPDVLEGASLSGGNKQTEGLHDAADLVRKLGGDPDQPRARRDKRAGQHAVESLHAHLTKEPDFRELRQTIGVVRVRLVRRHIERRFIMARIDADRRQSFGAQRQLAALALKFAVERNDPALDEAARKVLEAGEPPLTHITRRDVARVYGDDLAGELDTVSLVEEYFALSSPFEMFEPRGRSLRDQIERHMDRNPGDWSVEHLFGQIGAFNCSRARFAAMIEKTVHPLSRSGDEQLRKVDALNKVLTRDGYHLVPDGEVSGHPIFAFRPVVRGVAGRPKNLIFASRGPKKPEIGFVDAINNDIVVLSGEESCLIYDRPIGSNGLLWSDLVAWWEEVTPGENAAGLGARLRQSLSSDGENNVFATYFKKFRPSLGDDLPALLPQVYLHYDPAIVKLLRHRLPLPRQRMDFLLLRTGSGSSLRSTASIISPKTANPR